MSIALDDLIAELTEDVPAVDGVPSTEQYENAVKDAVKAFSERCGRVRQGSLAIVPGTATYDLPADFLEMVSLDSLVYDGGVMHSAQGLIPVPSAWEEEWYIGNGQITFYPTPTYTLTRYFRYKAGWVETVIDDDYDNTYEYARMTEREKRIVLLRAQAIALTKVANVSSGMKYSLGAVSVDNSGTAEGYLADAKSFTDQFEEECHKYNGIHLTA